MASGTVYSLIRANTQFSNAKMTINPKLSDYYFYDYLKDYYYFDSSLTTF